MPEQIPNGFFVRDLIVFNHLRRGGHVSKGFIFEAPDLTNSPVADLNDFQDQLCLLLASLHEHQRLQVQYFCDSDYKGELLRYQQETEKFSNVWTKRARNERFSRYWQAMSERKLRRQRVIFYISRSLENVPTAFQSVAARRDYYNTLLDQLETEFEHVHRLLLEIFGSGGARILPMSDLDHFRHYKRFLNPSLNDRFDYDPADGFASELSIQENCWHSEGSGQSDFGFFLDGHYHSLIVLTRWPRTTYPGIIQRLTNLRLLDFTITVNVDPLPITKEINKEEKEHDRIAGDYASEKKISLLTVMEKKQKKIHALMQGQTIPFHAMFAIRVWDKTRDGLNAKSGAIKNAINSMNAAQYFESNLPSTSKNIFFQTWPGWTWGRYEHRKLYAEHRFLADMLPVTSTFTGHLAGAEAIYDGPQNNLVGIETFSGSVDNKSPQHAVLLGMSGAGKSVTVCDLLTQTEGYFGYTVIIEEGLSYGIYTATVEEGARPIIIHPDGDPDLPLLLSLENYNDETKRATKATIFTERTIHHRQPVESVATPKEALLVTLNEHGCVDLDHMADLLNKPVAEFLPDLKGVIFLNPQSNQWETDDQYLSGNVREKLSVADAAAVTDPRFAENVEALKSVQPTDLAATEIDVRLGASWLPPGDVQDFTNGLLNIPSGVEIGHIHALGAWHISANWEAKGATANTTDWGTDRYTALELIEDALNLKTPTVYDTVDKKPVVNAQSTEAAREKQERIKERFKEWVWSDDSRRERLCRLYNDTFNHTRVRTFNGDHLTLPGASGAIQLHSHQKAGVWRILQTPNTLLAHVVGAGKTYTMVAAAMESRRLGLSGKPMFVVPNHMLGQFSTELLTLYPGANILAAGKEDFESQNRKKLFSRIATGNWDAVIVTHSGFERIPLSRETQERFFKEQLHELEMIRREHADSSNRRLVKELEKAKKRLEAKLQTLAAEHKKDNTLTFEELGVDRLLVDEAHYFKNLFYVSKMTRIAGLPQTASERAFDMYLKVRHVQSLNGGGGVVFATGTPIANSMAEMFTMQRYLQHDALKKHNLHHFDSWAATFGEPVTAMELSPDGAGYRLNTRFARFINVPELMQMFRQSADVQTAAMLNLPRPKLDGEKPTIRNAPATEELKAFVQSLAARAERLRTGRVDPSEDNMLKITSEGRKAALDLRLMKPGAPDEPQGKVNLAVEKIFEIWQESKPERSAQLVFCDLSTPKDRGFSVYNDAAQKLERLGIPSNEIAFIQDYDSDASKLTLFRDVRSGKVRVLFGSTQKMGSGTNVQERLIALHHLDAPWRPADVEQREGRILRQGNKNPVIQIFRYVTEGSFDAYMWQTLETKAKFIAQVMSGDMTIRRLEDLDSAALTYAEVKAIASGNPLVIEKAQVDAELIRLTRLRSAHAEEQYRIRSNLRRSHEDAEAFTGRLTNLRQDIAARQDTSGDKFSIELDGQVLDNRGIAGELIVRRAEKIKNRFGDDVRVGRFAGFDLFLRPSFNNTVEMIVRGKNSYAARVTDTAQGTIRSLEANVQSFEERASKLEYDIADATKRAKELETKVGAHFEREERYQQLTRRQSEIEEKLDLTKNQASSQVDADAPDANEQKNSEKQTKTHSPRPKRRAAISV